MPPRVVSTYGSSTDAVYDLAKIVSSFRRAYPDKRCSVVFDIDDTLIKDLSRPIEHAPIADLARALRQLSGCSVHIVTARENAPEMVDETVKELVKFGISYTTLDLCPRRERETRTSIARWKSSIRKKYAEENKVAHVLTLGDQWSDLIDMPNERAFKAWDKAIPSHRPVALLEIKDGTSLYGLKLKASE